MTILGADIGGTKVLLQLRHITHQQRWETIGKAHYYCQAFNSFYELLAKFLQQYPTIHIDHACLAIAGPIQTQQTAKLTNLPWQIDKQILQQQFQFRATLINDFTAVAYGISVLQQQDLVWLQTGKPQDQGVKAVLGAGTGLGQALIFGNYVQATEGGHTNFAPTNAKQIALLNYLKTNHKRVSYEKLLSGQGLVNITQFLAKSYQASIGFDITQAEQISQQALEQQHPLALKALKLFIQIYGAKAGDLALNCLPTGGLYLAGGIAPKILPLLQQPLFLENFLDKAPMQHLLAQIPVAVITNPEVGLLGTMVYSHSIVAGGLPEIS